MLRAEDWSNKRRQRQRKNNEPSNRRTHFQRPHELQHRPTLSGIRHLGAMVSKEREGETREGGGEEGYLEQ